VQEERREGEGGTRGHSVRGSRAGGQRGRQECEGGEAPAAHRRWAAQGAGGEGTGAGTSWVGGGREARGTMQGRQGTHPCPEVLCAAWCRDCQPRALAEEEGVVVVVCRVWGGV
jgi:hypothetical protein